MRKFGLRPKGREATQTPTSRAPTPLSQAFARAGGPAGDDDDELEILEDDDLDQPQQEEAEEQEDPEEEVDFFTDQGARNAQVLILLGSNSEGILASVCLPQRHRFAIEQPQC